MKKSPLIIGLSFAGILLLAYTFYRSNSVPLTHDEGSTFLNHIHRSAFGCLYDPDCWRTANSHTLNTMGVSFFTKLFGDAEWVIRFTNWLSHILYVVCSLLLISRLKPSVIIGIFGFAVLNFHPYLLEFFGLARGYGLATAWVMASITFGYLYFDDRKMKWVALAWLSAMLAVLSNFTTLLFFASFLGAWFFLWIIKRGMISKGNSDRFWFISAFFTFSLASMMYTPITTLSGNGEFLWGVDGLGESMLSITTSYLLGKTYTGGDFPKILTAFLWIGVVSTIGAIFWQSWKKEKSTIGNTWVALIMVFLMVGMVANHYVFGAKYPDGRKVLFLSPLLSILLFFGAHLLYQKKKLFANILAAISIVWLLFHLSQSINTNRSRDWYYDANTKQAYLFVKDDMVGITNEKTLGCFWIYGPSLKYYNQTIGKEAYQIDRIQNISNDLTQDYLYVELGQIAAAGENYKVLHKFSQGAVLKRK